ncbi:helix-turn-helix transcriptional regulator [Saccharopolyspora gloriosae]|uniref:helix-turn-helix domain-containing protein n=1 Tax=Saccharopolyspora gloriosae TaxID=455344 RepID=UPI001FB7767E|nr:helix-turn-helix transcriptional regulator [Saccharopolyspora gloriosae]
MSRNRTGSPRNRALGAELREIRERAGVTVRELAHRIGGHHSKYTRNEQAARSPSPEEVASIMTALGTSEAERDRLIEMAREHESGGNWLKSGSAGSLGIAHELTDLMEFERTATSITDISPILIPGLLQTSDYARAVMGGMPSHEVDARVAMRVGRRDILMRRNGSPAFHAFIEESALWKKLGGDEVMADQLRHVATMSERPNVTVQVVPADLTTWNAALGGSFIYFEFPKAGPIVHLEHVSSSAFLAEPEDIAAFQQAVDNVSRAAMTVAQSSKVIARRITELEGAS